MKTRRRLSRAHISRRDLLRGFGVAGGLATAGSVLAMFRATANGLAGDLQNRALGVLPRNYVFIQSEGAPARWMWDLFLNPNGETLAANSGMATNFALSGGRYVTPVFETVDFFSANLNRNFRLPMLWGTSIPVSGGGTVPMTHLLANLLSIRGVDVGDSGHAGAQAKMTVLGASSPSLGGAVADASSKVIPALAIDVRELRFRSRSEASLVSMNSTFGGTNMLQDLFGTFDASDVDPTFAAQLEAQMPSVLAAADSLSENLNLYSGSLAADRNKALDLMMSGMGDLNAAWNDLYVKYLLLIQRALDTVIPGINDAPVGNNYPTNARDAKYCFNSTGDILTHNDLRTMLQTGHSTQPTMVTFLAEHFAVAEFCLLNGYSNSIHINAGALFNLHPQINGSPAAGFGQMFQNPDMHFHGIFPGTYLSALYYCALSACLYELINKLKSRSLFNDTVIHLAGEFNRKPRQDGTGSDHAPQASNVSIWSGSVQGPLIIGDILKHSGENWERYGDYPGTWGFGAHSMGGGTVSISTGHVLASLAQLLRVPNPAANNDSLIYVSDSTVSSLWGVASMVDNT